MNLLSTDNTTKPNQVVTKQNQVVKSEYKQIQSSVTISWRFNISLDDFLVGFR